MTMPIAIYYIIFLFVLSGAALIVWTLVLATCWLASRLKRLKEASNA
jgi:hypothetical protein